MLIDEDVFQRASRRAGVDIIEDNSDKEGAEEDFFADEPPPTPKA